MIDKLTVAKGYETALGAALGDDLEAPIDPKAPMRWMGAAIDDSDPKLPDGVTPLTDHVKAPKELARRLAQIGIVTRENAAQFTGLLKPGQRLVSRDGDLWRWDGFAVAAHAPTGAARRLAEKNRLSEIENELRVARTDVEAKRATHAAAEKEVAAAAKAESAARTAWRDLQHAADGTRDKHANAERAVSHEVVRRSALTEAQTRLAANRGEAATGRDQASAALAALAPVNDLDKQLAAIRSEIEQHRGELAEARAQAQAIAHESEVAQKRLTAIETETKTWVANKEGAGAQIATLEQRRTESQAERAQLADAPAAFAEKRNALMSEVANAETVRGKANDALAAAEATLTEADRVVRTALDASSAAREQSGRAEERCEASKRRLSDLSAEIREMLEVEPAGAAELAGLKAEADLPDVSEIEEQLEKLKRDRERLGAVNLRAEEELREVEGQHTTLTTERDDLVEAIKRLRQGITNLNKEARERLLSSFEVVNGHFKRLFTQLFGGGEAELQLVESDDPLEAGLEILAKPPGKKPQTLSLLSGGEQALTAMALIFAVFLTNPSPICVLDEVDAPLDDHNVERFCDLLNEMTRETDTRFLIITHNPITMARMNRLYGVTMAERGVSQLVSVDLEKAVAIIDGAAA